MSASIKISHVSKRYGDLRVLDDLSLNIEANEFIVFLGPSGCGKSTLLRMIAGLESVDEGEIHIGGERIDTLSPGERGVAMVFQNYALYPHMSVAKNMSFGLENLKEDKSVIAERVSNAAAILEITHLLERKPAQLSGGQRQRVAIGRAIVKEPKAFLFDEPLSNLDALLRSKTRLELAQLHNRLKTTMVFVTHDQVEAMTLADRIVIMNECKIEQIGTPIEVYQRPSGKFVAGFVGSPAMNFFEVLSLDTSKLHVEVSLAGASAVATCIPVALLSNKAPFTLGVRAENLILTQKAQAHFSANVDVVERLGERTLVYCRLENGAGIVASDTAISSVAVNDRVHLRIDAAATHLFDAAGRAYHGEIR